jgi:hypothetical protein
MNQDLIQKLMLSKKIMDKHNEIPRTGSSGMPNINQNYDERPHNTNLQEFAPINGSYNISEEFLVEQNNIKKNNNSEPTKDMVMNSKLPDEIKRLMMEHPIQKPQQQSVEISDEVIAAASRLMNIKANGDPVNQKQQIKKIQENTNSQLDNSNIKKLVKDAVKEILQESGLLIENTQNTNELFSFKVGQHIFEGKITKIKKIK